jgi:toxin YoeB
MALPVKYSTLALNQLRNWRETDMETYSRIWKMITQISDSKGTVKGIGKPEFLKGDMSGYRANRITKEDRMIYRVHNDQVFIVSLKGHYNTKVKGYKKALLEE